MRKKFLNYTSALAMVIASVLAFFLLHSAVAEEKPEKTSASNDAARDLPARLRWKADGALMVKVPAGEFTMGASKNANEKPPHKVKLETFYIDRTEVTFKRYIKFCKETGRQLPVDVLLSDTFPEERLRHPVANVTWKDARAYCKWAQKRLPSEAEWEKACGGKQNLAYPWGNGWNQSACTNRINSNDHTTPAGARDSCKSPCGAMDMAGNVWEWTADWYKSYPGAPFRFDYTGKKKVARGGAFFYSIDLLRCASRHPLPPDDFSDHGGFRCVVSPGKDFREKIEKP